ncbi:hypothetical protein Hamer_G022091 [Homarus americanus]|uniref:Uncharacterized protein n=1 Tax=Homarus americanus TaxID=6706 RepID=A0A8J5JPG9_HOMAM|nr:hypothetical protein Hamer_G022091 [Homarus americanus]
MASRSSPRRRFLPVLPPSDITQQLLFYGCYRHQLPLGISQQEELLVATIDPQSTMSGGKY